MISSATDACKSLVGIRVCAWSFEHFDTGRGQGNVLFLNLLRDKKKKNAKRDINNSHFSFPPAVGSADFFCNTCIFAGRLVHGGVSLGEEVRA